MRCVGSTAGSLAGAMDRFLAFIVSRCLVVVVVNDLQVAVVELYGVEEFSVYIPDTSCSAGDRSFVSIEDAVNKVGR